MEKIRWKKKYKSGLVYLDNHRRNFLDIVNELIDTCNANSCETNMPLIFHRLAFYVEDYFVKKEMALRDATHLPFKKYKEEHDRFTAHIIQLQMRYKQGETGICQELLEFLTTWFENYIKLFDSEGAEYMRSKGFQ